MRIGFVAEPYEEKNASGMGYVVVELMRHLPTAGSNHEFVFYSSKPIDTSLVPGKYTNVLIPRGFLKKLWYFYALRDKPDALIFMVPMLPLVVRGMYAIPMCQELGSQKIKPDGWKDRLFSFVRDQILMRISLSRGTKIIAASEATKTDLIRFYGLSEKKIPVSYDGFQDLAQFADGTEPPKDIKPYFFFVGKVKYRKNVHGIVSAFIAFKEKTKSDCQLVLAGDYGGPYYEKIKKEIDAHYLDADIHFVGYTVKSQLYAYYANAHACLFPSLNEGFGMPIIEAMSLGTPVITSNISSMREVAGNAALLVNPHDVNDMSAAMERISADAALREELITKGKERAEGFSWPKAAREYIAVVEAL